MESFKTLVDVLWMPCAWAVVSVTAVLALVALVCPRWFRALATQGNRWVDSQKILAVLDKPVNIDDYFLRNARLLGVVALASAVYLAGLLYRL